MTQVFISYVHKDRDAALPIIEAFSQAGLNVWEPVFGGDDFNEKVQHALDTAKCVVFLWSKAAAQSEYFREREFRYALHGWSSDRLVLVKLDDTPLPVGLRDLSAISIRGNTGTNQLISRVQVIVRRGEVAAESKSFPAILAKSIGFGPIDATALVGAFVFLAIMSITVTSVISPEIRSGISYVAQRVLKTSFDVSQPAPPDVSLPAPRKPDPVPGLAAILMTLVLGAVIGAGAVWAVTTWSRGRSRQPVMQQVAAVSIGDPEVFVSYSRQDGRTVKSLVQQIEQLGYLVWIDRRSKGSQRFAAQIVPAIRKSKLVALMWSRNAFLSDHVIREIYVAADYKKPFIAFQLDPTEFPDEILYFVSGFPRVSVAAMDPEQLRSEIVRLVVI